MSATVEALFEVDIHLYDITLYPRVRARTIHFDVAHFCYLFSCSNFATHAQQNPGKLVSDEVKPGKALPTLFIIGDSTVRNGTKGQMGWGDLIAPRLDSAKVTVLIAPSRPEQPHFLYRRALGKIVAELKSGDFVLMQFGHNDGGGFG